MQSEFDVSVRGTGAVGLVAALALSRQGLRVALAGPLAEPTTPDIRAYALNLASMQLLAGLKVWDALPTDARTPVHEMRVNGDEPGATLEFSAWSQALPQLCWIVDAAELERALRAAVRFAPHVQPFAAPVPAALQVLAEGRDSHAREALGVRMPRHDYGQIAIAARLTSNQAHAGIAHQWFRSPDVLALLPLDRPTPEHGFGLVWSLPQARAAELLALDDSAFTQALNDATAGAAGQLELASARASWPLAMAQAEATVGTTANAAGTEAWVLVGDAAHVVHPLAGQGLNLGLADVASLASTLAARESWRPLSDPKLLARYARARRAPVAAMAQLTDGLLQLFASEQVFVKSLRNRGLNLVNQLPPLKRVLTARAVGG